MPRDILPTEYDRDLYKLFSLTRSLITTFDIYFYVYNSFMLCLKLTALLNNPRHLNKDFVVVAVLVVGKYLKKDQASFSVPIILRISGISHEWTIRRLRRQWMPQCV